MIDWVNAVLRAIMCFAFLMLIVRPMLAALSRKDVNQLEIEDAAQSSVNSAFEAWRNNHGFHYYDNPEYAEMMASNPNLELPDLSKPPAPELPAPEPEVVQTPAPDSTTEATTEPAQTQESPATEVVAEPVPAETTAQAQPSEEKKEESPAAAPEDDEEDAEESMEKIKAQLASEKKKKKQQAIPQELLNANSYEDKLMLVRMIVQQDQGRVSGVLKKMIQG